MQFALCYTGYVICSILHYITLISIVEDPLAVSLYQYNFHYVHAIYLTPLCQCNSNHVNAICQLYFHNVKQFIFCYINTICYIILHQNHFNYVKIISVILCQHNIC